MSVKDMYLAFKKDNQLRTSRFGDRVLLQEFLRSHLERIWDEKPNFQNGGLLTNYMTRFAIGFAYYDCRPTAFCMTRCYGLPISGLHDYFMLRLGVITSESLKTGDPRFLKVLRTKLDKMKLKCLKIGHWGDAVLEQIPIITKVVRETPYTNFWWYTRKKEIAITANELNISNLRAYLSLDPTAAYPVFSEYPYGMTYFFGEGLYHKKHDDILADKRLVAVFPYKKGKFIEDPRDYSLAGHPKICREKELKATTGDKGDEICLSCTGRCNYS